MFSKLYFVFHIFTFPVLFFFVSAYTHPVRNAGPASLNYFNGLSAPHPLTRATAVSFSFDFFFWFFQLPSPVKHVRRLRRPQVFSYHAQWTLMRCLSTETPFLLSIFSGKYATDEIVKPPKALLFTNFLLFFVTVMLCDALFFKCSGNCWFLSINMT